LADKATPTGFLSVTFLLPGQKKGNNGFPSSLLVAGFFGYFFFVAGDKEKVTI